MLSVGFWYAAVNNFPANPVAYLFMPALCAVDAVLLVKFWQRWKGRME